MILYDIASETHEVYGHGDNGTELRICTTGAYGCGPLPPLFSTEKEAWDWIDANRGVGLRVVKRSFVQTPTNPLFPK